MEPSTFAPRHQRFLATGHFTGAPKLKGGLQTTLVACLAASMAYIIAKFTPSVIWNCLRA